MHPKCPKCESPIVIACGRPRGLQKYECKDCLYQWIPDRPKRKASGKPCYGCGRTMVKDGFKRDGTQRYHCVHCGIRRSDDNLEKELSYYWHI